MSFFSPRLKRCLVCVCVCGFLSVAGCDKGGKLYPVSGKVMVGGKPLTSGMINFLPDESKGNKGKKSPFGSIGSDGAYTLMTEGGQGAPAGWYKVTVNPGMGAMGADMKPVSTKMELLPINTKYNNPTQTDLSVEVVSDPKPDQYDLKLSR